MTITGYQLVGYSRSGKSEATFTGTGAGKEKGELFFEASGEEIGEAVEKANRAFNQYRHVPATQRADLLEKIAANLDAARTELVSVASEETGLPALRLDAEVTRTVDQARLFASLLREGSWIRAIIDTADHTRLPFPKPDIRQCQQPIGVIGVFGASNFPFAFSVAGADTISALAAGCPVVYKAHPGHPALSELTGEIVLRSAKECAMPEGIFSLIQGVTYRTGLQLVNHPLVKAISFTGSFSGGKALSEAAARRPEPIPVYAEMGSVNPVFILPEMLALKGAEIAAKLAASNTTSAGQFCTNPGIIIGPDSETGSAFRTAFAGAIRSTPGAPMLTEAIFKGYNRGIESLQTNNRVSMSASADDKQAGVARAYMFEVNAADFLADRTLWEEVFGPGSVHVRAREAADMVLIARALPGQLTVSVWGTENDLSNHRELLHTLELKAGRLIYNAVPTGVEVTAAMVHGGPYPATTDNKFTSVGTQSIYRFTRPVCYQDFPEMALPPALQSGNPLKIGRQVNGKYVNQAIVE